MEYWESVKRPSSPSELANKKVKILEDIVNGNERNALPPAPATQRPFNTTGQGWMADCPPPVPPYSAPLLPPFSAPPVPPFSAAPAPPFSAAPVPPYSAPAVPPYSVPPGPPPMGIPPPVAREMHPPIYTTPPPNTAMSLPSIPNLLSSSKFLVPGPDGFVPLFKMGTNNIPIVTKERMCVHGMFLIPPSLSDPQPLVKPKPAGCKTVCVSGLPEGITDEKIKLIFDAFGKIDSVRMFENGHACRIRFKFSYSTDIVVQLSGFCLKLMATDSSKGALLHIDYDYFHQDQFEFNCARRMKEREKRHQETTLQCKKLDLKTPPFTLKSMQSVNEDLKTEEHYKEGMYHLLTWLEKEDCSKGNISNFFCMIQGASSLHFKWQKEKELLQLDAERAMDNLLEKTQKISNQLDDVTKVFELAQKKRVWDHFSKGQRKRIECWQRDVVAQKNAIMEELVKRRKEEEMELSMLDSTEAAPSTDVKQMHSTDRLLKELDMMSSVLKSLHKTCEEIQSHKTDLESLLTGQFAINWANPSQTTTHPVKTENFDQGPSSSIINWQNSSQALTHPMKTEKFDQGPSSSTSNFYANYFNQQY